MRLFITAAIGSKDLLGAAERLISQISQHNLFDKYVIVTEADLVEICPWLLDWYTPQDLRSTPGFGYFAWKSAIAEAAFSGIWGEFQSVMYLDAGCEVLPGNLARRKIHKLIKDADARGVVGFGTGCTEWKYSKVELNRFFPSLTFPVMTEQIQGGTWVLAGRTGREFAKTWNQIVRIGPEVTNNESANQPFGFVENRNDQSVLSLLYKSLGLFKSPQKMPNPRTTLASQLAGIRFPIWASRNRTASTRIMSVVITICRMLP